MIYARVCLTFFRRIMQYEYYRSAVKKFGNTRYFDILNNIYTAALQSPQNTSVRGYGR